MHCSNFARTQSQPLISKFPIRPQFSILNPKPIQNNLQSTPKSSILCFHPKSRNLFLGARVFSSGTDLKKNRRLPCISSAYKNKSRETKKDDVKTSRSSWVDSAENLLKNERNSLNTSVGSKREVSEAASADERVRRRNVRTSAVEIVEESEEVESINDSRWDGAKSKYKRFFDEREPRFERPEVRNWNKQENWGRKVWKESKESSLPKMVGQGVYGVGPVLAAVRAERREFYALYVQEGLDLSSNNKKKDKKGVETILKLTERLGLKVIETSKHDLNMIVDSRPHQGLVLDASPLDMVNIKELETVTADGKKAPVWVALDEVTDPQNLGAIIRSCYYFGVEGVVLCAKNSAPLSGVVSKASAGSLELIELRACKNMMQFLTSSIDNGWRVIGGSVSSKARNLNEVEANVPTILVLGSEGSGLRPLVERSCSELVKIPGNISADECEENNEDQDEEIDTSGKSKEVSSFLAVESLNVSVAAGVLLYHLVGNNNHLGE